MHTHTGIPYQLSGINRLFPLQEAPNGEGRLTTSHASFTTSDLCTWKNQHKGLKEGPLASFKMFGAFSLPGALLHAVCTLIGSGSLSLL